MAKGKTRLLTWDQAVEETIKLLKDELDKLREYDLEKARAKAKA